MKLGHIVKYHNAFFKFYNGPYRTNAFSSYGPLFMKNCRLKQRLLSRMNSFNYNSMKLGHIIKYQNVFKFQNGPYRIMP